MVGQVLESLVLGPTKTKHNIFFMSRDFDSLWLWKFGTIWEIIDVEAGLYI